MKLVKVAGFGINMDSIATWVSGQAGDEQGVHETLEIRWVGGGMLTLRREQAAAFRQWLEANAEDATLPSTPSAEYVVSQGRTPFTRR